MKFSINMYINSNITISTDIHIAILLPQPAAHTKKRFSFETLRKINELALSFYKLLFSQETHRQTFKMMFKHVYENFFR